jgi:hypothetical protein
MTPTLTEIRTALQNLAVKKGRPDYELCTAKQVKFALENGLDHPLIGDVLSLIAVPKAVEVVVVKPKPRKHRVSKARLAKKRKYPTTTQIAELTTWLNSYEGSHAALARMAGCSHSILCHIKLGTRNCTLDIFNKVSEARKQLEGMAA